MMFLVGSPVIDPNWSNVYYTRLYNFSDQNITINSITLEMTFIKG